VRTETGSWIASKLITYNNTVHLLNSEVFSNKNTKYSKLLKLMNLPIWLSLKYKKSYTKLI